MKTEMSRNPSEIAAKSGEIYLLSGHVFDSNAGELRTGTGETIVLRNQSAEVLAVLVAKAGETVSKAELIEAVWGNTAVTDDSLVQCIADIRRALGDDGHDTVQTFPKKGYRLIPAPIAPDTPGPPTGMLKSGAEHPGLLRSRRVGLLICAVLVVIVSGALFANFTREPVTELPRIAVLPFEDFSAGEDKGFLSDAIAEGIITELARSKTYAVIARNSSFKFRGQATDVRQIGKELGADFLLQGSQQKNGKQLRVTAQLIDAENGTHLWAHSYEQQVGDLFAVQDRIIRTLVARVGRRLEAAIPERNPAKVSALHFYLQGSNAIRQDFSAESNRLMRSLALKAIEADPEAQYGYINMAWSYRNEAVFGWQEGDYDREEALRQAAEYAQKAVDLAPNDPDGHYVMARIYSEDNEPELALAKFERVIALNPSNSNVLVASTTPLLYVGRTDEAILRIEQAKGIDPFFPSWFHWQMGWALWEKDDCEGALREMQKMNPINKGAHRMLVGIYACLGRKENAEQALAVFMEDSPDESISKERKEWEAIWTAPGSLERWLEHMRFAGMPE